MAIRTTGVRYDVIAKDSASKVFDKVGKQAGKLDGGLGKAAKSAAKYGAVMGGAVAAGLVVAADKAVAFQSEMTKISTQAGGTTKDVAVLDKQVLQLGKSTQQGPQQLADSLYHLKSIGLDNVASMKDLKVASDLAAVGQSDLEATTNALGGAWRSGIKGAETFGKSAATVNAIIGAGNMRMEDFVSAIGTGILPSAKSFGLSLKSVGSALALMTDEGIPATDAATRLRMSISLLGAPSDKAEKQLKRIGLTGTALAKEMRSPAGLVGAIGLLKTNLDKSGLSAVAQSQLISRAFGGGRSSSGILTLLNNYDVLVRKQDQITKSMGKFPSAVAEQRKTVKAQFDLIKSNFDVMAIETGDKVLPALSKVVVYTNKTAIPAVGRFTSSLEHMIPVGRIEGDAKKFSQDISDFVTGFNPTTPKAKTLTVPSPTIKMPTAKIPGYLRSQILTVPSPTIKASTAKIPTDLLAPKPVKSQAQKLGEQVRGMISGGIGDAAKGINWKGLGGTLGKGVDTAFGYVAGHSKQLGKQISKAVQGIDWVGVGKDFGKTAIPLAIGFIDNIFQPLFTVDFWKKHWLDTIIAVISILPIGKVADAVGGIFTKIPWGKAGEAIGKGLDKIPWSKLFGWADRIGKTAGGAATAVGKLAYRIVTELTQSFARQFPKVSQFLYEQFILLPTRLGDVGRGLRSKASGWITDMGKGIAKKVPLLGSGFVKALLRFWGRFTFYQAGVNLIEGLYNGVASRVAGAGDWLKAHVVDPVVNWVKSLFGIHSPSTVFSGIGSQLIAGLYHGIGGAIAGVSKWLAAHVISPITSRFSGAGSWLYSHGADVVTGLKRGAVGVGKGLGKWFGNNVISPVKGAFSKVGTLLVGSGGSIVSGLVSGTWSWLGKKGNDFKSWAGKIRSKIVNAIIDVFKIGSPSKVMATYGGHIVAGLQVGMLSGKKALHSVVKGLFHSPLDAAKNLVKNGVNLSSKWMNAIGQDLTGGGAAATTGANQALGKKMMLAQGFQQDQWPWLKTLWNQESGWRTGATNPSSGAYGIPQALPPQKMASAGPDWLTNPATQIKWGLAYIKARYGTPGFAMAHERSLNWYAKGGLAPFGQTAWVGEKGPELMQVTPKGTRIYNNKDSYALAKGAGIKLPGYATGTVGKAQERVNSAQAAVNAAEAREDRARGKAALAAARADLRAAELRLSAAKKELATANTAARRSKTARTSVSNALANGFLKTLETGTAAGIASAVKSMNTRLQNAGYGSMVAGNNRTASKLGALATRKASIASQISAANSYATDQASSLGDYLGISDTSATSVSGLITQMQGSQKTAKSFASEIAKLSKMGLNKNLLSQVAAQGPGGSLATMLSGASSFDVKNLNALATSQSKLTTSFGRTMADAMYDTGKDAGKGFLTGLKDQEKQLQAEMNKLADGMVKTIKKRLGIHSPSTVARDQIGKQFALGAALGVHLHTPKVTGAVHRMGSAAAAVRVRSMAGGGRVVAAGGGGQFTGNLYLDSGQFLGVVQGTVEPMIQAGVEEGHRDLAAAAMNAGGSL